MTRSSLYTHDGRTMTLKQWAVHLGVQYKTLWLRLRDGMPPERAFVVDPGRAPTKRNPHTTLTKTCEGCGQQFTIPKCRDWREHSCSTACKEAVRRRRSEALAASRTRTCLNCGGNFVAKKSQLDDGTVKYCSNACQFQHAGPPPQTLESRARAVAARKASMAAGKWQPLRGDSNPRWRGGFEAYRERQRLKTDPKERAAKRRAYLKANPLKAREWSQKRKERKHGRLPRGTLQRIASLQKWRCAVCRCDIRKAFHMDHIMPLAKGGKHEPTNIQLLCPTCNICKSAKHPVDFMQERGFLL